MTTGVTRSGNATQTGRSRRFVGMAAGGLAAVIAVGFVFAVNQGNDATNPVVQPAHPMVSDAHRAKAELLAERELARSTSPGANIEKYRLEQAGATGGTQSPGANIEKYRLEQAGATGGTQSPGANIEKYRLEQADK
jgi:general stress protein YciG